jgi:hypothetical protein
MSQVKYDYSTGNWNIPDTGGGVGPIWNPGTKTPGTSDGDPTNPTQYTKWKPLQLISEGITSYDTEGVTDLGTVNTTGEKWKIEFCANFSMDELGFSAYPITGIIIEMCKVVTDNSGNLITIKDNGGVDWKASEYPALKEVDFDLPNDHPLYDKFIKSQGTYKKICQWVIYIDDINTYNSAAYTYNTSSGPINRSFKFTIPYDNLIINYKGIDYNPQFYQSSTEKLLTINNTYFIRVLPNRTSLGSISENKSVDIYYTLNRPIITKAIEGSSYYRTGGDGIINWNNPTLETDKINGQPKYPHIPKTSIVTNTKYQPPSREIQIWNVGIPTSSVSQTLSIVKVNFNISQICWFITPSKVLVNPEQTLTKNKIFNWVDPTPNSNGYWYQLYDSWTINNGVVSIRNKDDDYGGYNGTTPSPNPTLYNTKGFGGHFDTNGYDYNVNKYKGVTISYPIHYYFNNIFEKEYNYQFIIELPFFIKGNDLKLTTPWQEKISLNTNIANNNKIIYYNVFSNINSFIITGLKDCITTNKTLNDDNLTNEYKIALPTSKPINRVVSSSNPKNPLTFTANTNFSSGIQKVTIYKTKWFLQGYAAYSKFNNNDLDLNSENSTGWHYKNNIFIYYNVYGNIDNPFGGNSLDYFSGKTQDIKYINYNFITRYIKVQKFNISFDYTNNDNNLFIDIYLGIELPNDGNINTLINNGTINKIGTIGKSKSKASSPTPDGLKQYCEFIGLEGNQNVIIVVGGIQNLSNGHQKLKIENFKIEGEYHPLNNTIFKELNNNYKDNINNLQTSYSIKLGSGNNVVQNALNDIYIVNSKIGNSNFLSGIWETGVWQSGWRDTTQYYFIDVDLFYSYDSDRSWRFIISGNTSTNDLNIGDKISISNVAIIDINGDRRLIKNYFTIIEKTEKSLVVEFNYEFPIRSIQRDSDRHLIVVTKSIWLNGIFLNGRFKGNWIDGVVKGFPYITKIEDSHWVDGLFDGGHFKSNNLLYNFLNLDQNLDDVYVVIYTVEENNFRSEDNFYLFDINGQQLYDNIEFIVLSTNNSKSFFTNIKKDQIGDDLIDFTSVKYILTDKNTGLIQNIEFNSNNTSNKTISKSFVSEYIFSYNSWLDLVYDSSSATNIFKPQNIPDNYGNFYSENNLYGYITNDILSSVSRFRDSFSNTIREYKLGTKWKIFYDYIGESSTFDEYFHSIYTPKKTSEMGWSFNVSNNPLPSLSRFIGYRTDDKNEDITGKELKLVAEGDGGLLNLDNRSIYNIPFRYTEKIKSGGYSFISFDLIEKNVQSTTYQKALTTDIFVSNAKTWYNGTYSYVDTYSNSEPIFSFSNTNITNIVRDGKSYHTKMTYLPIYENINHLETTNKTKIEYFFNKRDLMLTLKGSELLGSATSSVTIDNLKFYETDMIPFFQYFKLENINKGVQIPNGINYVRFNYNTPIDYKYVSYTNIKTFDYFNINKFSNINSNIENDKYWLGATDSVVLDINKIFSKNI